MNADDFRLPRKAKIDLGQWDAADTGSVKKKEDVAEELKLLKDTLSDLQDRLFAENRQSLLVILQGMDCSGKDGVIKHTFLGINPQGYRISSFKKPTVEETAHDFLWRVHKAVPEKGYIAVFNRSHYEDILVPRVHGTVPDKDIERRFKHILNFESLLSENGTRVIKIFLHISKDFQIEKIKQRIHDVSKHWKFDKSDLLERQYWGEYQEAYEEIFQLTNVDYAPWYLVPSNHRWYRNYAVSKIIVSELEKLDPKYPELNGRDKDALNILGMV